MGFKIKSQQSLLLLAEFYCSKRETSRVKLGQYLVRKCREQKIEPTLYKEWIDPVLDECERTRMVNDERYSQIIIRDYKDRGKGKRYIEQKLKEKGIPKNLQTVSSDESSELERAITMIQKKFSSIESKVHRKAERKSNEIHNPKKYQKRFNEKAELRQKLIQKLMTSGFSLDVSKKGYCSFRAVKCRVRLNRFLYETAENRNKCFHYETICDTGVFHSFLSPVFVTIIHTFNFIFQLRSKKLWNSKNF